jgi:hypothetical protein
MATPHTTRNQRRSLIGLAVAATGLAAIFGISVVSDDGGSDTVLSRGPNPATESSPSAESTGSDSTTSVPSDWTTTTSVSGDSTTPASESTTIPTDSTTTPDPTESDDGAWALGSTEACRADPTCPSSEHRTGDLCGATLIIDQDGYLEGRHDAERGLPYQIDGAPAPGAADDDDDDGTIGPQTRYRAAYVQGWCDGGGEQPTSAASS